MFAQIGPLTTTLESLATAIGAGVLLGGVAMGAGGMALGASKQELGKRSLTDGYIGGVIGAVAVAFDLLVRYIA